MNKKTEFKAFQWIALLVLVLWTAWPGRTSAQTPCPMVWPTDYLPAPTGTTLQTERKQSLFNSVWESINQHHVNAEGNKANWLEAQKTFLTRALATTDDAGFYAVLQSMVQNLGDHQSVYYPPWESRLWDGTASQKLYGIGVFAVPNAEGLLVTHVLEGSYAAFVGLQRRNLIVQVEGKSCPTLQALAGPAEESVRLTLRKPNGTQRDVRVQRIGGGQSPWFSLRRLEQQPKVVLLTLPTFNRVANEVSYQLSQMLAAAPIEALIIDLRANPGGSIGEGLKLAGQLTRGDLFELRPSKERLAAIPGLILPRLKDLPLVILVDAQTESISESFAAGLQAQQRARVVGVRTPGKTQTLNSFEFGDGSRLWLPTQDMYLPDGTRLGGRGVTPDTILESDWYRYDEQNDPYIRKALELLGR
jgi:carboxyl-terminal processing protease